jgi:hypothetical protein
MPRTETYKDGVLVSVSDDRTVSATAAERLSALDAWKAERLAETDWAIIRAQDPTGKPVPQAILDERAAIRAAANAAEAQIDAIAAGAADDDDKAACDAIEAVGW